MEEQKTIIKLQQELIVKLLGQVEESKEPTREECKLMEAFSGISDVRLMLEEALK